MIDPFRLCVAAVPLAAYFLLLGLLNLRRRPTILAGHIDAALLSLAVLGLVVIGPMELFMPEAAVAQFRHFFWPMMLSLYGLSASLAILMARPRLVVYNATLEHVRKLIGEIGARLDPTATWAGDSLALPQLGVQLRIEEFAAMRNVSIISNCELQHLAGWRCLQNELDLRLRESSVTPNPRGISLIIFGTLLLGMCVFRSLDDMPALAKGLQELLRN